jgi:hypothetical protein
MYENWRRWSRAEKDMFRPLVAAQDVEYHEHWIAQELARQRPEEVAEEPAERKRTRFPS